MAIRRLLAISRHLLSTPCISHPPPPPRSLSAHALQFERCTFIDSAASENPNYSPLGMVATHGDWVFTQQAEMFPGMDYKHWEVNMQYEVGEGGATKDQIIDCYIKTLAHILGSEEEAKKKIYKVICRPRADLVFGCELDWETAYKLEDLPQVDYVTADYYSNSETKDYGGELFVDGKIVQRSPE